MLEPDLDHYQDGPEPPHNLECEQALLGALLMNNSVFEKCYDFLRPEHFFNELHTDIYSACLDDFTNNVTFTPITLKDRFKNHPIMLDLVRSGTASYLSKLAVSAITVLNAVDYARLIVELSKRRVALKIAGELSAAAYKIAGEPIDRSLELISRELHDISAGNAAGDIAEQIAIPAALALSEIAQAMKSDDNIIGVHSGLIGLDYNTGGFRPGELWILAGRPGMGKTAAALNFAKGAARNEANTLFFSLEMKAWDLTLRIMTDVAFEPGEMEIFYSDARNGRLNQEQYNRLSRYSERVATLPLYITDLANRTVESVRLECIRQHRALEKKGQKLNFVVIDYLQLLSAGKTYRGQRVNEISEITRSLKLLAKELDVAVLLLSQLSRSVESRENKRPQLSDLRDSGAIEQDADAIMFIYRELYYLEKQEPKDAFTAAQWREDCDRIRNDIEIILSKQRSGPTKTIYLKAWLGSNAVRDGGQERRNGVIKK